MIVSLCLNLFCYLKFFSEIFNVSFCHLVHYSLLCEPGGVISPFLSYLSMQDVGSERLEHTGPAHIANTEAGPLKGQNMQPVNGVLCRYKHDRNLTLLLWTAE